MNKIQLIRYKVLDRCFKNPIGCFGINELIDQCNKALSYERATDTIVSERTIREDIRDIQERYGAVFDAKHKDGHKKLYRYEDTGFSIMPQIIPELSSEQKMLQQVMVALSEFDEVPQYQWLRSFIEQRLNGIDINGQNAIGFQNNPDLMGMEHFSVLLGAILAKQPLSIVYQPYKGSEREYITYPYYLKQYNNRWFLVAQIEGQSRLSILSIDRIITAESKHIEYKSTEIDMETYFDDIIGVTKDERVLAEDVLIKISHQRYPYIRTKPFHYTQKEVHAMRDNDGVVVKVHVRINKELEAAILELGNDAEVIAPETLRASISDKISALYAKYSNFANTLQG